MGMGHLWDTFAWCHGTVHIDTSRELVAQVQVQAIYGPQSVLSTFCNHYLMFPVKSFQVDTHTKEQGGPSSVNLSSEHTAQGLLGQYQAASGK